MKRIKTKRFRALLTLAAVLLMMTGVSGCARAEASQGEGINVVCTVFPQYDWVRQLIGNNPGNVNLTLLLDNGVDLHSFQPTAADMLKISTCDLFIYTGGESDEWVRDALEGAVNKDMTVISLMDALGTGAKLEEIVEGMEDDEAHDHGEEEPEHDEAHDHGEEEPEHDGEEVYDEHVWLSLKNAEVFCAAIADALSTLDPQNAGEYASNLDVYNKQLSALDAEYQAAGDAAAVKTLLFGDRFPFRYLLDDYGLSYYAAFPGCSAETEASFETVVFLAGKMDELGLKTIISLESSDQSVARTVVNSTKAKNQQILVLDSLQSVAPEELENGAAYLSVMENNLNVLKEALR